MVSRSYRDAPTRRGLRRASVARQRDIAGARRSCARFPIAICWIHHRV